jgi:hypothetical protein
MSKTKIDKKLIEENLKGWKINGAKKWGKRCEICNSKDHIQGHHFFPKRHYKKLMFDVDNYVPLCRSHHFQLERLKRFDIMFQIIIKRGISWLKKLRKKL